MHCKSQIAWYVLLVLIFCGETAIWALPRTDWDEADVSRTDIDHRLLENLKNPPKGYGEVAFYWWQGDTLRKERLLDQLNQLQDFHISSLQINYAHDDYFDEVTGARPHYKTVPEVMSKEWWELVKWFTEEAGKRGMSVSLSDYCLGIGQKSYFDKALRKYPEVAGYLLQCDSVTVYDRLDWKLPDRVVSLSAFPLDKSGEIRTDSLRDLRSLIRDGKISCRLQSGWKVYVVYAERQEWSYDPMHPLSGKGIIEFFYDEFERNIPGQMGRNLNFFFSDELNFKLKGKVWNPYFAGEFVKRKGYDVCPELIALWKNIGRRTAKIRMDYNDVYVSLSEENYFKPIYDYNEEHGMTLGCDHGGRGYTLDEFGDYFRTQRWNQGPGSDQPFLAKSIIKAKVAASIAHMYERPRVWLEGFYGSGWSTNTASLTDALFANLAMGYNLLTLHGLYYTTYGRWWEWAPPCNHFRMPYWEHMKPFLAMSERLCYLLSQGKHVADVAVLYPVEAVVANPVEGKKSASTAFATGEFLYKNGIDFDFMDYESLHRARICGKRLQIGGESFSVVVIPSMKAVSHQSLLKLVEFSRNGGIVVNIGEWPSATEQEGQSDQVRTLVKEIGNNRSNVYCLNRHQDILSVLDKVLVRDFRLENPASVGKSFPYVHHRVIGSRDVYAVYGVAQGKTCFFRAKGNVELWNPMTAETRTLTRIKETPEGTYVEMPLTETEMQLIVFSPADLKTADADFAYQSPIVEEIGLGREWQSEVVPVLDNKWGDYYLPASDERVGAWVEQMSYVRSENMPSDSASWTKVIGSYGPQFYQAGPFADSLSAEELTELLNENDQWKEYRFSWRYGVEGDCGRQGYHGLKGKIHDEFIRLGELAVLPWSGSMVRKAEKAGRFYYLYTFIDAPYTGTYRVLMDSVVPTNVYVDGDKRPLEKELFLRQGVHRLVLEYENACSAYFLLQKQTDVCDKSVRQPLSMRWYGDKSLLKYSVSSEKNCTGWYRFMSAPGLDSLSFTAYGDDIRVYVGGEECRVEHVGTVSTGADVYACKVKEKVQASVPVLIKMQHRWGYAGGAVWETPVKQYCQSGIISVGDWAKVDGLKSYSGGIRYAKNIRLDSKYKNHTIELDLKNVVSTAEVYLNGKSLGVRFAKPWTFDLTGHLTDGTNRLEILVYNTLGNIYTAIPTVYRKESVSGLLEEPCLIIR